VTSTWKSKKAIDITSFCNHQRTWNDKGPTIFSFFTRLEKSLKTTASYFHLTSQEGKLGNLFVFKWSEKSWKKTCIFILFNESKRKILGNLFISYESEKSLKETRLGGTSGIMGSNCFRQWWNCSKHVMVKRLANKTTHRCGSSGKDKQPSESIWLAKEMVAMEWNNQGSSRRI